MTTHEQIEREVANLHEEIYKLQKQLEEVEAKLVKSKDAEEWPREQEKYFYINDSGHVDWTVWKNDEGDIESLGIGNVFSDETDANFAVERLKVIAEMRKFAFEPDWSNDKQEKYGFYYSTFNKTIIIDEHWNSNGAPVFESEDHAQACIDAIGEERLKKYYFGVKDDG